jgi:hypothetical protein
MIGPSTQVVEGLIIACFEPIRICRTLAIHDPREPPDKMLATS